MNWRVLGACRDSDPGLFFADREPGAILAAKRICAECPVRETCLDHALEHGEKLGIWGGLTDKERRRVLRERLYQKLEVVR